MLKEKIKNKKLSSMEYHTSFLVQNITIVVMALIETKHRKKKEPAKKTFGLNKLVDKFTSFNDWVAFYGTPYIN